MEVRIEKRREEGKIEDGNKINCGHAITQHFFIHHISNLYERTGYDTNNTVDRYCPSSKFHYMS
jgi:hypothetical protein